MPGFSQLPFGQCVQLKPPTFMPQPDIGVSDASHASWSGVGRGEAYRAFNLGNDFRRMFGCALPLERQHPPVAVQLHIQHADCVKQRRQFAFEDSICVAAIEMSGPIKAVGPGVVGSGRQSRLNRCFSKGRRKGRRTAREWTCCARSSRGATGNRCWSRGGLCGSGRGGRGCGL